MAWLKAVLSKGKWLAAWDRLVEEEMGVRIGNESHMMEEPLNSRSTLPSACIPQPKRAVMPARIASFETCCCSSAPAVAAAFAAPWRLLERLEGPV